MRQRWLAVATALLTIGTATAQVGTAGDPGARLQQLQAVALQRFDSELRTATAEARQLSTTSPERAAARLRTVQQQLDADTVLPAADRRMFTQRIQEQIAALSPQNKAQPMPSVGAADPKVVQRDADRRAAERARDEAIQIKAWINRIATMQQSGQLLEAERQSLELSRMYPENPAAQSMNKRASMVNRVADARALIADIEKRTDAVLFDIQRAATPPLGDIEFPKDWKERTANRIPNPLTEREKSIMRSLESPITLDLKNRPFTEVMQQLSTGMKLPIVLDKSALTELEVDSNTVVNLKVDGVSTRTAIRTILNNMGLAYVIRNETILVTTQSKAKEMTVTRVYYLGDLIRGVGPFGGAPVWGPQLDELQAQENARVIVDTIQNSIDPNSWKLNGGPGTIVYHAPTGSLIIKGSAEVHAMMGSRFSK